jgi:rod shape-determining protein MreD
MRKALLAGCLLAVAVVVQLTLLNGLRLPGGGVPDLVLVAVAALALIQGPLYGTVAGFTAGLCIDVAPPASQLIGQYALVFCLVGWAAGRASRVAARSAVSSVLLLSLVVAAGEALIAVVGLALEPAQVTLVQVRLVLPPTVGYDLLLGPFLLSAVLLLSSVLDRWPAGQPETSGMLAAPARRNRTARTRQPSLVHAAGRQGDGWVGTATRRQLGSPAAARRLPRLHPASGVAGSASGLAHPRATPAVPVNLRLSSRRRGDAAIGNAVGAGLASKSRQVGRHPGLLAGARQEFRPHAGVRGGSAAAHPSLGPRRPAGRTSIRFSGHHGDATVGRLLGRSVAGGGGLLAGPAAGRIHPAGRRPASVPRLRFSAGKAPVSRRPASVPRLRFSAGKAPVSRRPASVPRLRFSAGKAPVSRRPTSAPRFRRRSDRIRMSALAFGVRPRGALDEHAFRSLRKGNAATPRLRLRSTRPGMLGGSGRGPALAPRPSRFRQLSRRGTGRVAKTPRFGYRRRSLLSALARRRAGGRWLAAQRAGGRSGASLLVRRTGGTR